ncbi:hypothetical protein CONPUDRAFT_77526 [Coniophora puteana RWD-64-598 SS2]|uniref:Uncharacterized protein n=1 Tax=Coniophora puteana (strain RWD-64-598) TaxID=741705 RepID=A0A5M3M800_CONPW|nr:uncharacterized protein CONPUDRAFT_77526 [Coniophora puteana RWD-64-598 SS2]EIW75299.1 hypothetical protein CONPUDRAFT_77526 [Coniophora puteana RWD-64-598 SS2]
MSKPSMNVVVLSLALVLVVVWQTGTVVLRHYRVRQEQRQPPPRRTIRVQQYAICVRQQVHDSLNDPESMKRTSEDALPGSHSYMIATINMRVASDLEDGPDDSDD